MNYTRKNEAGFSLIELMVVVAIIGILSAVAVPQFQKFQRKAKQSEAKASLSALYTAQKIFLAEHSTYYPNLWALGVEPEGATEYRFGHFASPAVGNVPGMTAFPFRAADNTESWFICGATYETGLSNNCFISTVSSFSPANSSVVTANTFQASARHFDLGGALVWDDWTINHRKEVINTRNAAL